MNWRYTINIKDVWAKYSDFDHEHYDNDVTYFKNMKREITEAVALQLRSEDKESPLAHEILSSLKKARKLSSFNKAWNRLYDFCDYKRIWLATNF